MFDTFMNEVAQMQSYTDAIVDKSQGMVSTQRGAMMVEPEFMYNRRVQPIHPTNVNQMPYYQRMYD